MVNHVSARIDRCSVDRSLSIGHAVCFAGGAAWQRIGCSSASPTFYKPSKILIRLNIVPNDDQPFSWTGRRTSAAAARKSTQSGGLSGEMREYPVDGRRPVHEQARRAELGRRRCSAASSRSHVAGLFLLAEVAEGHGTRVVRRVEVKRADLSSWIWATAYGTVAPICRRWSCWYQRGPRLHVRRGKSVSNSR